MAEHAQLRRQLTLFLPSEARAIIEPIRRRLDPIQHGLIAAHVTLCRDDELGSWGSVSARLSRLPAFALTMAFGEPEVLEDGCVLLRPIRGADEYAQLRSKVLGEDAAPHGAHLTLLHPRNAAGAAYDRSEIARAVAGLEVTFMSVSLIEKVARGPWEVRQHYGASI